MEGERVNHKKLTKSHYLIDIETDKKLSMPRRYRILSLLKARTYSTN